VFSEASRVLRFRNICSSSDSPALKHVTLGGLMRKSHESLREKYDCSCAELEELMVHCKRLGALGSRLTGAGWGGASVHLVRTENVRTPYLLPFFPRCAAVKRAFDTSTVLQDACFAIFVICCYVKSLIRENQE
jgi:mevalonate kinase